MSSNKAPAGPHRAQGKGQKIVSHRARRGAEYLIKIPERGIFINRLTCRRRKEKTLCDLCELK